VIRALSLRLLAAILLLFLVLVGWECLLSWYRYQPVTDQLGGFLPRGGGVLPVEPGGKGAAGPRLDPTELRGARYLELVPRPPLAWLIGTTSRVRLVGLYVRRGAGEEELRAWGGGPDPLVGILDATRPVTRWLPGLETRVHDFRDLGASKLRRPQVLSVGGEGLQLGPGA